jgi:type IV pilus assembly protein PilM
MFKGLFHKRRFVGLDVGASSVKAIELSGKSDSLTLTGLGVEPLAPDTIYDGQILEHAETSRAISKLFHDHHLGKQRVAAGLGGDSTILKNIQVPLMTEEELKGTIEWHAEEHIPYDISDVWIDYQITGSTTEAIQVLLAACRKERVENLEQTLNLAATKPVVIDFDMLALQNCYTFNYQPSSDSQVALLHIGASSMILLIVKGHRNEFSRDISIGGNWFTGEIQNELGLTFEQAEAVKLGGAGELETEGTDIREVVEAISMRLTVETDFERLTETIYAALELEISRSLDFYRATADDEPNIQKILISGGSSKFKGLKERLALSFEMPVETLDPFRRITFDARRFSPDYLSGIGPEMAVAVGLALRGTDAPTVTINLATSVAEKKRAEAALVSEGMVARETKERSRRRTERVYLYKGRTRLGEIVVGERVAQDSEALRMQLRREEILLTSFHEEDPQPFLNGSRWRRKKVGTEELERFMRRLVFLMEMGSPIIWCLESLAQEQKNKYFKHVLNEIISDMGQEIALNVALGCYPEVFDEQFVNLIEAGENCGILDVVLVRLLAELETTVKMRRNIRVAILSLLSSLAFAAVSIMLAIFTVLHSVPDGNGAQNWYLRFWARAVAATEAFLGGIGGVIALGTIIVAVLLLNRYFKTPRRRRQKDELLLRMPVLGAFLRNYFVARFARLFSTLLSSGVPMIMSLEITARGVGNAVFEEAIEKIRDGVYRGKSFSESMTEVFPFAVTQAVTMGEQIGALDASLGKIADLSEREVNESVSKLPLTILSFVGLLLVLITGSLILAAR